MTVRQGEEVAARIRKLGLPWNPPWDGRPAVVEGARSGPIELEGGIRITLLSPRPQDMDRVASFWQRSLRGTPEQSDSETDESSQRANETTRPEPLVYIASTHMDKRWQDGLRRALAPLLPEERIIWSEKVPANESAPVTDEVGQRRRNAIQHARIGIVLVSPDALASKWVQEEVSTLVATATESEFVLTWILLRPSAWEGTALSRYQALGDPGRPLSELPAGEAAQQLQDIAEQRDSKGLTPPSACRHRGTD